MIIWQISTLAAKCFKRPLPRNNKHRFSDGLNGYTISRCNDLSTRNTIKIGKKIFEEVSAKLSETIANSPAKDVEKNVKSMLGSAFNRMDLITREEFDIQQQVLIKTRTKLAELEARLAKLEGGSPLEQVETVAPDADEVETVPEQKD